MLAWCMAHPWMTFFIIIAFMDVCLALVSGKR